MYLQEKKVDTAIPTTPLRISNSTIQKICVGEKEITFEISFFWNRNDSHHIKITSNEDTPTKKYDKLEKTIRKHFTYVTNFYGQKDTFCLRNQRDHMLLFCHVSNYRSIQQLIIDWENELNECSDNQILFKKSEHKKYRDCSCIHVNFSIPNDDIDLEAITNTSAQFNLVKTSYFEGNSNTFLIKKTKSGLLLFCHNNDYDDICIFIKCMLSNPSSIDLLKALQEIKEKRTAIEQVRLHELYKRAEATGSTTQDNKKELISKIELLITEITKHYKLENLTPNEIELINRLKCNPQTNKKTPSLTMMTTTWLTGKLNELKILQNRLTVSVEE